MAEAVLARGEIDKFQVTDELVIALHEAMSAASCKRRQIAALAVYIDSRAAVSGYNQIINGEDCERCPLAKSDVPSESDYTKPGQSCPALHAEEVVWFNALAEYKKRPDLILVTDDPCPRCNDLLWRLKVPFQVVRIQK